MIIPLLIGSAAIGITLIFASMRDIKERRVPFRMWYPMLAIAIPMTAWTYIALFRSDIRIAMGFILISGVFCLLFYFFAAYLHLFGGADAWALIFVTACVPTFPIQPFFGIPLLPYFPLTVLLNAVLLNLVTPVGILIWNICHGNRAPIRYMLVGYPVDGNRIEHSFGFIIEEFEEKEGVISRRFIRFGEAIKRMISGERRMYTKDLKINPEKYERELAMYRNAGFVWISYGIPFIVPITAGFFSALLAGDILFVLIQTFSGV